jgi:hypothetical protein
MEREPVQILGTDCDFPKDNDSQYFLISDFYRRRLPNGERVHRN